MCMCVSVFIYIYDECYAAGLGVGVRNHELLFRDQPLETTKLKETDSPHRHPEEMQPLIVVQ